LIETEDGSVSRFDGGHSRLLLLMPLGMELEKGKSRFWREGFAAGQGLNSRCPYLAGSLQARDWLEGWAAGLREPGGPCQGSVRHEEPAAGRWRAWLKKLLAL
jgi:hypothetical protein